jgi:hypothetical protein
VAHPLFGVAYPSIPSTRRHSQKFLTLFGGHLVSVKGSQKFWSVCGGHVIQWCLSSTDGGANAHGWFILQNALAFFSLNFSVWYPSDTRQASCYKNWISFSANALHRVMALEWGTLETGTQNLFQECPAQRLLPYRWISLPGKWRDLTSTP